ncbi:hypothetical protein D9M71_755850 [compost metagenome]
MFVANAIAVGRDAQGRHALHEACRQSTQAAITQCRVGFQQANTLKIDIQPAQGLTGNVQQAQVAQAVVEQAADEKLQ